ncbi:MAG TPA: phosphopantetheine-binding protein [Chitinophagaceae bacterium]|nr:phosphopantetheine-binding protein [Chitinophagales bacterium]HNF20189.1 phosphopantetheine-binding protein [Chitinophagales bacterium]HNL82170.1 phosphopantetheine-binding protein [Chitinophagaceae bacterium]
MKIEDFIARIEEEFEDVPKGLLQPDVPFREILEWTSVNALLLMALISTEYDVNLEVDELKNCITLREIYNCVTSKMVF